MLVMCGVVVAGIGLVLMFSDKIPFLGKLPGDINIKRDSFQFFYPITSGIIISIILSAALWLFSHIKGK
jgi:hypothetical protein